MSTKNDVSTLRLLQRLVIHKSVWRRCAQRKKKWRVCYGLSKSDHLTDAEVSGYRFQPQRQRHVLEDTLEASDHEKKDTREAERTKTKLAETVSTGGGAEPIC